MEILSPSPPPSPGPAMNSFLHTGWPLHAALRRDNVDARVHIAVGRSPEKTLSLLRWAFRRFACVHVTLLHVHQPSPVIPTLLGKIPAAQATEELVLSHRMSEKDEMSKIIHSYLSFCHRAQVQANLLVTESEQIHDGIVNLVKHHGITKLVMGSTPDNCFRLKASYGKASFMAKNAPSFCEIWFVWRGRHIWTREASAAIVNNISVYSEDDVMIRKRVMFSSNSNNAESFLDDGYIVCKASTPADLCESTISDNGRPNDYEPLVDANHFYNSNASNLPHVPSAFNSTFQPDSSVHMESLSLYPKENLDKNFEQVMAEAERSRKDAFVELLKRKETESRVASAFARAKTSELSQKQELKMREELEEFDAVPARGAYPWQGEAPSPGELDRDADLHCKIAHCGISHLLMEDAKDADPEYQRIKPQTPKSDIYSFGIVILQLLTGKQDAGLPSEVKRALSCRKLWSLLDPTAGEWPLEVARRLAELGLKCSETGSAELLTPEVVRDLEQLHLTRERQVPSFFLCPILKEVMHDPHVGADGLTYEGRAICKGTENGPPITPNHALRFAIHDWLSQCSTRLRP
ncbi:hypothetical protein GUJ93_ZPchr0012g20813 [Zizania palustris]|uniref:RING-type E3 ubiquitin transferase n=1 Tax=Zizania palustris TaxID=103762 RepID=A0A8J6BWH2_ZIZPA|nr:hypothetical protein GUJ93_ZPchr0012g20813 [Zizania palustris]